MFVVVFVLAIFLVFDLWAERRARRMLADWAAREGYEVLSRERSFWGGPFWWRMGENWVVYKVAVRVSGDRTRTGYVCCRPFISFGDSFEVIWKD